MTPLICRQYGLRIHSIIHSETQDRKCLADIHFATEARFVDSYIDEEGADFTAPSKRVEALNNGFGMMGEIAELFETYLSSCQKNTGAMWTASRNS